jgi:hypothetical protein
MDIFIFLYYGAYYYIFTAKVLRTLRKIIRKSYHTFAFFASLW